MLIKGLFIRSLKHHSLHLTLTLTLLLSSILFTQTVQAVPAFARQTGMECNSCHFQNFPALNSFGRVFRAGGYIMAGTQTMIEGQNELTLPSTLNASIITKIRYQLDGAVDDSRGEIQWPDEAAILVGGRAAEHVGFLMELGLGPQEGEGTADPGTGDVSTEVTGNFLSTKFHFAIGDNYAIIPFSTDGLGVGYGFELLNTGAQRSQRPIENRRGFSAGQLLGTASGEATGIAFVYQTPEIFVNYSHWTPTWSNVNADPLGGLAHYLRLAYMPNLGGWDTGFGLSYMNGTVESGANDPATETFVDGWTIDAQLQGEVGEMPLGVYASYGVAPKSSTTDSNIYNTDLTDDKTAYGLAAKLGVIPGKTQVFLGYSSLDELANTTTETTIGIQQMLFQNIKLELYNVSSDSSDKADDYTMLMLFGGF